MKKCCYLFFLIIIITGCNNRRSSNLNNDADDEARKDSLVSDSLCKGNAFQVNELGNGHFFKMDFINGTNYRITWGNDKATFKSRKIFEKLGNGTLDYLTSNDYVIVLSQVCGTSCTFFVILPIAGGDEKVYYEPKAIDLKRNLIAYVPNEANPSKNNAFVIIENFLSGKITEILESNLCPAASKGDCIDCCYFEGDSLHIRWQGSKWSHRNNDIQQKVLRIDL